MTLDEILQMVCEILIAVYEWKVKNCTTSGDEKLKKYMPFKIDLVWMKIIQSKEAFLDEQRIVTFPVSDG